MLKILGNLPQENIGLALSGGVDSMTVAHFLLNGYKDFTAFYFNHGTPHGEQAEKFVRRWCSDNNVELVTERIDEEYNDAIYNGPQDFYRWNRYAFLNKHQNNNIILAHHLDDVLETWLFSSFHGNPKLMECVNMHMSRPFLLTTRDDIKAYAIRHDVEWIEDESNEKLDYMRNRIRHRIVPEVEKVNPGIRKVLARKLKEREYA
jgi:tRNA(Ile)-lysidine synthase